MTKLINFCLNFPQQKESYLVNGVNPFNLQKCNFNIGSKWYFFSHIRIFFTYIQRPSPYPLPLTGHRIQVLPIKELDILIRIVVVQ